MSSNTQYFKVIRKITTSFASLFSNITLVRYNPDGSENQRLIVPVDFADKEKYVKRLQGDPDLTKKIQIALPRISYQLTGFKYDSSRKLNTNTMNFGNSGSSDTVLAQYNPVPYDFDFGVTLYTRNIEDGNQILEHILPYFCPDYSLRLNLIPEMGVTKTVPVVLNSVQQIIDSEGLFDTEVRTVMWTLNFTVKAFIFGAIKESPVITNIQTNVINGSTPLQGSGGKDGMGPCCSNDLNVSFNVIPNGYGNYYTNELVYQGFSYDNSYAVGRVQYWSNTDNSLYINEVCGSFKLNQPIVGVDSRSIHIPNSLASNNFVEFSIITTPNPANASANSYYTANTVVIYD